MEKFYDLDGNPLNEEYKYVETRTYKTGDIIEYNGKKYKIVGGEILDGIQSYALEEVE